MKNIKLRYYLRGLGIGILVTTIILSISSEDKVTMTDAQIRAKATELGMVDADSIYLSELQRENTDDSKEEGDSEQERNDKDPQPETQETSGGESESVEEEVDATEELAGGESESVEETLDDSTESGNDSATETESKKMVTFEISSGVSSLSVSRNLEELGLIEDAEAFDAYLCNIGYSRSVRTGSYEIAIGTSEEEIAKIITGKR